MSKPSDITIPMKDLSGSKLRCLVLTSMPRNHLARLLSSLVLPVDASVDDKKHHWLPEGLLNSAEPKLGECGEFLTPEVREKLTSWWLVNRRGANTPNWDLVSSCTIEGAAGLILVEAKAHDRELKTEGKTGGDA